MKTYQKEFEEWAKENNKKVFDKLSDVTDKYDINLIKGQKCTFVNEYGIKFPDYTIMGFSERQNNMFTGEDTGRYVYLDKNSYWFPVKPESILLNHQAESKGGLSMKTDYGLKFRTVTEINPAWQPYDQTIAQTHLSMWGVIAIDKYGLPIDSQFDYEAIKIAIEKGKNLSFPNKITDIHIFSLKEGMGISCKINGITQSHKRLTKEDINAFNDHTDRKQLAQKYFSPLSEKSSITTVSEKINSTYESTVNKEIIGKTAYYVNDRITEITKFDNVERYLASIRRGLRTNPTGFTFTTITTNPEIRKSIADIVCGIYGRNNPHSIEWYEKKTPIPVSSTKELQSSGSKTLVADTSFVTGKEPQISNYSIFDKSTGKTESLNVGAIDLNKQSPETIKELLSGKQVKMTTKSGTSQMVGLSKTPGGWGLQIGRQTFNTADSTAEI